MLTASPRYPQQSFGSPLSSLLLFSRSPTVSSLAIVALIAELLTRRLMGRLLPSPSNSGLQRDHMQRWSSPCQSLSDDSPCKTYWPSFGFSQTFAGGKKVMSLLGGALLMLSSSETLFMSYKLHSIPGLMEKEGFQFGKWAGLNQTWNCLDQSVLKQALKNKIKLKSLALEMVPWTFSRWSACPFVSQDARFD